MMTTTMIPRVGQTLDVRGLTCTVVVVRPCGTVDVEAPDGRCFRVSGLPFPQQNARPARKGRESRTS